jgi:hypothetical protein
MKERVGHHDTSSTWVCTSESSRDTGVLGNHGEPWKKSLAGNSLRWAKIINNSRM